MSDVAYNVKHTDTYRDGGMYYDGGNPKETKVLSFEHTRRKKNPG